MQLAVHYSQAAAELLTAGQIAVDRFKCPAWPDLVTRVNPIHPVYIHFPLKAGAGIGNAIDTETDQPADWGKIEHLLAQTGTPFINIHLSPTSRDQPDIPLNTTEPEHIERVTACLIRDVTAVVRRFGPERVIVENDHDNGGAHLRPAYLPQVIRQVVDVTGCGLLLDLAHVRLAAQALSMEVEPYLAELPVAHIRELHVSGVQDFDTRWLDLARRNGHDPGLLQRFTGRLMDHLPMTTTDYDLLAWALAQVHTGTWGQPWIVAFEYGGVGPVWEAVTDREILAQQLPRLREVVPVAAPPVR